MFLDSDDLLYPDAVDRVVGRLMPGDSKAQFRLQVIDDDGRPGPGTVPARKFPLGSGDVVAEVLRRGRYVSSPNSGNAFPRRVIEQMGPVPGDLRAADTFYGYGAPFLGPVCAIEDVLGAYRMHETNKWEGTSAHGTPQIPHFGVPLDLARHRLVRTLAERHHLVAEGTSLTFCDPNHLLARMASLRLEDPVIRAAFDAGGEVRADTTLGLLRAAVPVVVPSDSGAITKRVATAALLVALATLPPAPAGRLAHWYFDPHSRPPRPGAGRRQRDVTTGIAEPAVPATDRRSRRANVRRWLP